MQNMPTKQNGQKVYKIVVTPEVIKYLADKDQTYLTVGLMKGGYC